MNHKEINIIEFPSNLGLKQTEYADEPGVRKLPEWLRKWGFHDEINPRNIYSIESPAYSMEFDESSGVRNAGKIAAYAKEQSRLLKEIFRDNSFQVILGGDCSILIGACLALKSIGNFGLFFLDGHTDFIGPDLSETGGAAGMDLAIVTGYGNDKLTNIENLKPYIKEENVYCVGNRYLDETYLNPVRTAGIHYFDLEAVREIGISIVVRDFLKMIEEKELDGFLIHFDADVLNDDIMPAVDSRQEGGLSYPEMKQILEPLVCSPKAVGMEITILDPDLDPNAYYTRPFIENIANLFK